MGHWASISGRWYCRCCESKQAPSRSHLVETLKGERRGSGVTRRGRFHLVLVDIRLPMSDLEVAGDVLQDATGQAMSLSSSNNPSKRKRGKAGSRILGMVVSRLGRIHTKTSAADMGFQENESRSDSASTLYFIEHEPGEPMINQTVGYEYYFRVEEADTIG